MLAKCIWKMYQKPEEQLEERDKETRPTVNDVIKALEKTIEVVSLLPKPRHGQDPVLEPHYKMVSVLHKLVMRTELAPQDAAEVLQRQPYAIQHGEAVTIEDSEDWESYVIKSVRHLRDKDKSNWQHRIVIRHARILFESDGETTAAEPTATDGDSFVQAKAAFSVLRESMFTKTMVMNVWKCDAERPGRHHVYTEQYVRLMTRILVVMNDRTNMEALLRRIRKKGADFYHFADLWLTCVLAYIRLLRQTYQVPPTEEDVFKNVNPEEFDILAERITEWVGQPGVEHRALSAMKEAIELKKLNSTLMKAAPIDDLVTDCYSIIYAEVGHDLPGEDPAKIIEERQRAAKQEAEQSLAASNGDTADPQQKANGLAHIFNLVDKGDVSRAGSEAPEKMEKQASSTGEHYVRRARAPGVRRPDIMRRADQAVLRLTEPPPRSAVSISSRGEGRKSRKGSTSSGKNGAAATPDPAEDDGDDVDAEMQDASAVADGEGEGATNGLGDGDDSASDMSSPPGSVHDSADDESDLSDVPPDYEDNAPPALLFPNLRRSVGPAVVNENPASSTADGSSSPVAAEVEDPEEDGEEEGTEEEDVEAGEEEEDPDGVEEEAEGEGLEDGDAERKQSTLR